MREFARPFYKSKLWQLCRTDYIGKRVNIDGGLCEECHDMVGEELHHKIVLSPANINDRDITINHNNLMWLCKNCHFKKHREIIMAGFTQRKKLEILSNGIYIDGDGMVQPQQTYIVYGSPLSGKREYVLSNKQEGDLVVNLDTIKQSISMCYSIDVSHNLIATALSIREYLYKLIEDKQVDCKNIWIISSLSNKQERTELAQRLRAEMIYIDSTYKDCIDRAKTLTQDKELTKCLIDKWFADYQK